MAEHTALALDDPQAPPPPQQQQAGPAITCPHCGAPVKYAAVDVIPPHNDTDATLNKPPMPDPNLDEGGAPDAVEACGDKMNEEAALDDDASLFEKSTGESDPSIEHVIDKTQGVEASDDAALEDSVEADEAALGDAPTVDMAPQGKAKSLSATPRAGSSPTSAQKMSDATMKELRELREATARLEKRNALNERNEQIRKGRALLQRGLHEGKLTPKMLGTPQKPTHTRRFAMRDPAGFASWLAKEAPIVVEFRERGTAKEVENAGAFQLSENIDKLAREKMKADDSLDYKSATMRVLSENPRLQNDYDHEMSQNGPREIKATSLRTGVR
jgi:hypothetical protein